MELHRYFSQSFIVIITNIDTILELPTIDKSVNLLDSNGCGYNNALRIIVKSYNYYYGILWFW